jgi:hypothetical protein
MQVVERHRPDAASEVERLEYVDVEAPRDIQHRLAAAVDSGHGLRQIAQAAHAHPHGPRVFGSRRSDRARGSVADKPALHLLDRLEQAAAAAREGLCVAGLAPAQVHERRDVVGREVRVDETPEEDPGAQRRRRRDFVDDDEVDAAVGLRVGGDVRVDRVRRARRPAALVTLEREIDEGERDDPLWVAVL